MLRVIGVIWVLHGILVVQGEMPLSSEHVSDRDPLGDLAWDPTGDHFGDHDLYHTEDHTEGHTEDPTGDHFGDHVLYHTEDRTEDHTEDQTEGHVEGPEARLFLSGLIESGRISEARALSAVKGQPFPDHVNSYAGFLTVNKRLNSNLFFWFFEAETNYESSPVLLWLQGGPGDSSLIGLFEEMGPFSVSEDGASLVLNPYSWHKNHSIIYIDNPVGAGFSFTDHDEGYATNVLEASNTLHIALMQFFHLFPELQKNDFFIAGESFAGKFVPALGFTIHSKNPTADLKINLKGIAVGNGFTDPISMLGLSEVAFNLGLIDVRVKDKMRTIEHEAKQSILDDDMDTAVAKTITSYGLFTKNSKFNYTYNFLHSTVPPYENRYATFVRSAVVRSRLHVGDAEFSVLEGESAAGVVHEHLRLEYLVSAKPWLEKLLDHYHVLYYSGQLDVIVAYSMSVKMYQTLRWGAADEYRRAQRKPWFVEGTLAGYTKSAGNFTEVLVRNAGHMVPADQPVWALDLITRFTSGKMHQPA